MILSLRRTSLFWSIIAVATTLGAMAVAFLIGARHDYAAYISQWDLILAGGEPWSTSNTYGPAYNLLAAPFALHPLLPKLIFVLVWQVSSWYVMYQLARRGGGVTLPWLIFWLAALPFNPLFWSFGVVYGSVDSLVAALSLSSLALHQSNRRSTAAVVLAFAALLKVYPVVFAPFMALEGRRINWRFLTIFATVVATGFALSFLAWGESAFHSILYNSRRGSGMLSIFRFLRGEASPIKSWVDNADHLSLPAMALGDIVILALVWKWRLPAVSGAFAGILATLLLYKVGHHQFFLVVPLIAGLWYAQTLPRGDRLLGISLIACMIWLAIVSGAFLLTHLHTRLGGGFYGQWTFIQDWIGLPTFAILLATLVAVMRHEWRTRFSRCSDHAAS